MGGATIFRECLTLKGAFEAIKEDQARYEGELGLHLAYLSLIYVASDHLYSVAMRFTK